MRQRGWLALGLLAALSGAALRPAGEMRRHALATVEIDLGGRPGHTMLVVRFPVPAGRYGWRPRVTVAAEPPGPALRVAETWVDPHLLLVTVAEAEPPYGRELHYRIRAGGLAGLLVPELAGSYRQPVTPAIVAVEPEPVPTRGPLFLRFNTAVEPDRVRVTMEPAAPGEWSPVDGDPSRWRFDPSSPLAGGMSYRLGVDLGLEAPLEVAFRAAEEVRWLTLPRGPLPLYPELEAVADQELAKAHFELVGVPGRANLEGARVTFQPHHALMPGTTYLAALRGTGASGELAPELWLPLGTEAVEGYWLEVCLTPPQVVRVYHGRELVRVMPASAGTADKPTPTGTFRLGGRGEFFWNPRYGQGARYWVRFQGPYLFHSLPFDAAGQSIAVEELKLGWPASHGCVRLDLVDATWLYENVPDGSPVIIHP